MFHRSGILSCALLFLISCARVQGLPPEEVLTRSARATRDLQSALFSAQALFDTGSGIEGGMRGEIRADGRIQHAGGQLQFSFTASGGGDDARQAWDMKGDVIVAAEQEIYVQLHELTGQLPQALIPAERLDGLLGRWWMLPVKGKQSSSLVTPDPELLQMQAEVVDVTRDRGILTLQGRQTYHYDTMINRDKLIRFLEGVARERTEPADPAQAQAFTERLDASGELWIDTDTFFVRALRWMITSKDITRPFSVEFRLDLGDFNAADPIEPPADVLPLPEDSLSVLSNFAVGSHPAGTSESQVTVPVLVP